MTEKMIPTDDQEHAIRRMVAEADDTGGVILGAEPGTGKTLICVETALRMGAKTILVIAPLGTRVGWERTFRAQGYTGPITRVETNNLKAMDDLRASVPGVYIVGREYFRLKKNDWSKIKPDFCVADEAHFFANRQTLSFKQMKTLKPKFRVASSGTWFGNKFEGSWAVSRWLWTSMVDPSFWRWVARWAHTETIYMKINGSLKEVTKVTREKNPGSYASAVPCYVFLEADSDLELVKSNRYVELTPAQRKMYSQMENDAFAWLEEHPLVAELPIAQRTRLRQMTLGTVTLDDEGTVNFADDCKSGKFDALQEILADLPADEKVLILTSSAKFARVVAKRLGAALWIGATKHDERERILSTFGDGKYLVAGIAALGEGVDGLQHHCSTMIWLDKSENNMLNQQVEARLVRKGQTKPVHSYEIIATDTLDEGIMNSLLTQTINNRRSMEVRSGSHEV